MEADETADTKQSISIEKLAETLKIRLIWQVALPSVLSEKQRGLFFSAAKEAIVNAVKHAEAKAMDISFTETETHLCFNFTNDGKIPLKTVEFTGGLLNLSTLAGKQGATVSVNADKNFTLSLYFPKNTEKSTN